MKHIYLLSVPLLLLTMSCANEQTAEVFDSCPVRFSVGMGDGPAASGTKSGMVEDDGMSSLTLSFNETEGIFEPVSETKGTQFNELSQLLSSGHFNVSAWNDDDTNFIPADSEVIYNEGISSWINTFTSIWKPGEPKTFYAYANIPDSGSSVSSTSSSAQVLNYTVPGTANEQKDILLGYCRNEAEKETFNGIANIVFYHPLTAVRFELGENVNEVGTITLKNVYASGSTPQSSGTRSYTWSTSGSKDVTGEIGETFLLIPQNLASKNVTIEADITLSEGTRSATFTLNTGEWISGRTYTYRLGYEYGDFTVNLSSSSLSSGPAITLGSIKMSWIRAALVGYWHNGNIITDSWSTSQGTFSDFPGSKWEPGDDGYWYYSEKVNSNSGEIQKLFSKYTPPTDHSGSLNLELLVQVIRCEDYAGETCKQAFDELN